MASLLHTLHSIADTALRRTVGFKLVRANRPTRSFSEFFTHLKRLGFTPATVIDVGAADGTPDLHEAFPDAQFVLIEPLAEFEPALTAMASRYRASVHICAAADAPGQAQIAVSKDLFGSSLDHTEADAASTRTIPITTLDALITQTGAKGPMLVKVDVQGKELSVIKGVREHLKDCEVIIMETGVHAVCDHDLHATVSFMKALGYSVYDILDGLNRPYDNALGQVDLVFVKDDGMFRQSTAWR